VAKKNEIAPQDGAGAAAPARVDPLVESLRAWTQQAKRTTDSTELERIAADALRMRRALLLEEDAARVLVHLVEASECYAVAARRIGVLFPAGQSGRRNDLRTSSAAEEVPPPVQATTLSRYRQLATIPDAAFDAALERAREVGEPITQTALLKLAAANVDPLDRPTPMERVRKAPLKLALREIDRTVYALITLADALPGAGPQSEVAAAVDELAREIDGLRDGLLSDERVAVQVEKEWPKGRGRPEGGATRFERERREAAERAGDGEDYDAQDDDDAGGDA
jgi:hypothetical protein